MSKSDNGFNKLSPPNILYIDIETAPTLGYFYNRYDVNISPDQVVHSGFVLCYQAAWNGGKVWSKGINLRGRTFPLTPKDDRDLIIEIAELIEKADIVIGHNAARFDIAKIKARMVAHGLKPFKPPMIVDTLKDCRRFFKFEANSLDSVCQELGIGRKFHSGGFQTSIGCINGDKEAWKTLLEYGEQDVVLLRDLYHKLKPYLTNHPNYNLFTNLLDHVCPNCGSSQLIWRGYKHTPTMTYKRFSCKDCGTWGSERKHCIDKEKRPFIVKGG